MHHRIEVKDANGEVVFRGRTDLTPMGLSEFKQLLMGTLEPVHAYHMLRALKGNMVEVDENGIEKRVNSS